MTSEEFFNRVPNVGIVPVVKINDFKKATPLAKALLDGGISIVEITFRTEAAEDSIRSITRRYPEMIVGAGTVINPEIAEKAVSAGASFIVSAGLNEDTVKWCEEHRVPVIPGVCTPSEIEKGLSMGLTTMKFFPAEASGGTSMLKDLAGPFPQVKFMATGGINISNLASYAALPNITAVGGSWMVKSDLLESGNWEEITRLSKEAMLAIQGFSFAHVGINSPDESSAVEYASFFSSFGFTVKDGRSSIFLDSCIEVTKKKFPGTCGHIAIKCLNIPRAIHFLSCKGLSIDEDTISLDGKGNIKSCYLKGEIGGFAIHLLR